MKKILFGTLGLVAMAVPALATILPTKTSSPPPVPAAPIYDWTGFYVGGNGGWVRLTIAGTFLKSVACLSMTAASTSREAWSAVNSAIAGRWARQFSGLEAQGDWANISSTHISLFDPTISPFTKVDGLGLFTGQIGYSWGPSLLYVKGGAAMISDQVGLNSNLTGANLATVNSTRWGATVGIGFEYLITPNWSVGLEYDYLSMGHNNNSFGVGGLFAAVSNQINQNVDMVTARFNYKFGGPVVARY